MEYLLVMTLSGSAMTCLFLLARRLLKERLCADIYYLLARAAALYYLIPLPFVKDWYRDFIPSPIWDARMKLERIPLTWTSYAVYEQDDVHINAFAAVQTAIAVVWLSGICVLLVRRLAAYAKTVRRTAGYAETKMTDSQRSFIDGLRKEYGVRRRVSFLRADDGEPTFTFGVVHLIIVCGKETGSPEAEVFARHEMVHIKRLDVLWKILMESAAFLHWWNPVAWKLRRHLERVCELSCDETVMRGKTKEERKAYLRLVIEEAREEGPGGPSVRWQSGFGSNAKYIRERMDNLMRMKKWNRAAAGALAAALIFANSLTVFAYRDGVSETMAEDVPQEELNFMIDNMAGSDTYVFTPGGASNEATADTGTQEYVELLYDIQFVDEEGNVYQIPEDDGITPYCNHSYVSGEVWQHFPQSGGSCIVKIYKADCCSKCHHTILYSVIRTITYDPCPH